MPSVFTLSGPGRKAKRRGLAGAQGKKTCYVIRVPATWNLGSTELRSCRPRRDVPADALVDYNLARRNEGLPPLRRLPTGTKITKKS